MTLGTKGIIHSRFTSDGEYKKYRSDEEQLQRQREKEVQNERDRRAREQATNNNGTGQTHQ